jgi:hypothetical protein
MGTSVAAGSVTRSPDSQPDPGAQMASKSDRMDTIVSLAKRRGLVYPSSEIYGGCGRPGTTGRSASS